MPLTNISRTVVVAGHDFSFSINFSHENSVQLAGTKKWDDTYAASQGHLLLYTREIVAVCIDESRSYHRE